ncbi:MAG: YhbY family RNA-binding protein [Nanoarchaeota archaeon]
MKLKEKAKLLEPVLRIGKSGITDSVVEEIKCILIKKKLIKIKFLRSALADKNKKQLAEEIARKTESELIDAVGFVVVLYKE